MFNRQSVLRALRRIKEHLPSLKCPENGLVILSSDEHFEVIIPPIPVAKNYYRCDNRFHVEEFEHLFEEQKKYLIAILLPKEFALFVKNGTEFKRVLKQEIDLPTNTRRGGFSANRFRRLREEKRHILYNRIVDALHKNADEKEGTFLYGCGDIFNDISKVVKGCVTFQIQEIDTLETIKNRIDNDIAREESTSLNSAFDEFISLTFGTDNVAYILYGREEVKKYDEKWAVKKVFTTDAAATLNCPSVIVVAHLGPYEEMGMIGVLYHTSLYEDPFHSSE